MRLTKIYTKTGDKGSTLTASGQRVSKADQRIEAYGTIDELNACMGLLLDELHLQPQYSGHPLLKRIYRIQNELFDLGAELATLPAHIKGDRQRLLGQPDIQALEQEMDAANETIPPLMNFVLPGGHRCNSYSHLARTVCRRAEREIVRLRQVDPEVRVDIQIYVNRLSDWLFVMGRAISQELKAPELLWKQERAQPKQT